MLKGRIIGIISFALLSIAGTAAAADTLAIVGDVEAQPLIAQVKRVAQALEFLGSPLTDEQQAALDKGLVAKDAAAEIQKVLDPLCLAAVHISAESRVKVEAGPIPKQLMQQGWRVFLVKVNNNAGLTAALNVSSPNAAPLFRQSSNSPEPKVDPKPGDTEDRWLDVSMFAKRPLNPRLSGLKLEYRVIELYSRDAGKREAKLLFDAGQGTQDIGFRNEVNLLFDCEAAVEVKLEVLDDDLSPTTAHFTVRDTLGRVYPSRARRLEPDFFFHDQVYRQHGESLHLPPGEYKVQFGRGPEYIAQTQTITVPDEAKHTETFRLKRWIKLTDHGWYSGDHHVHAAGCAHYESPTQGVTPEAMMRHVVGEDLNVGCVLSWGPCWYYQKQFFEGKTHALSQKNYLIRYDVEVSGFPSSHAGHLCLLRLKEDDYPGTTKIDEWPSWDLPVLKWGKEQGGVVGFSHSGWGLDVKSDELPNYLIPPYSGIGANEYIVDVTHGVCDFISAVDTPIVWELNIWYHTLNCGYTTRISGETDFPCIYGERVGLGRAYVKVDTKEKPLDFDRWVDGIRDGRSYCGDGRSHLINFAVNGVGVGEVSESRKAKPAEANRASFVDIKKGGALKITARAAALLDKKPRDDIRKQPVSHKPYWHIERARIGDTRNVPVELIVNGQVVAKQEIVADGQIRDITFDYTPDKSSWVALRIFATCHTNPIFVEIDGQPIRASKKSAEWCLAGVEQCWKSKVGNIRKSERPAAKQAYDHARAAYRKIIEESVGE